MASVQRHRPMDQTGNHTESVVVTQKKTSQSCFKTSDEHSLTNKVKEMANSAYKMFTEHHGQSNQHGHRAEHGMANGNTSVKHGGHATTTDKKKKDGHGGNFMANIGEHVKHMSMNMKKKRDSKVRKHNDASSDNSSSSDD